MANQLRMAAIDALHAQGWSQRAIVRRLGVHRETISRHALVCRKGQVRRRIEELLERSAVSGSRAFHGLCRELYEHRARLWRFLTHDGVEPTNNASERALRHAVIWRKLSFGTQRAAGSRFVETLLTVVETCRQQARPVFQYLIQALEAHASGRKTPSLLPEA